MVGQFSETVPHNLSKHIWLFFLQNTLKIMLETRDGAQLYRKTNTIIIYILAGFAIIEQQIQVFAI